MELTEARVGLVEHDPQAEHQRLQHLDGQAGADRLEVVVGERLQQQRCHLGVHLGQSRGCEGRRALGRAQEVLQGRHLVVGPLSLGGHPLHALDPIEQVGDAGAKHHLVRLRALRGQLREAGPVDHEDLAALQSLDRHRATLPVSELAELSEHLLRPDLSDRAPVYLDVEAARDDPAQLLCVVALAPDDLAAWHDPRLPPVSLEGGCHGGAVES